MRNWLQGDMFSHSDRTLTCDRQKDGRTDSGP